MKKTLNIFSTSDELFTSPFVNRFVEQHDLQLNVNVAHRADIVIDNYSTRTKNVTLSIKYDPIMLLVSSPRLFTDHYGAELTSLHRAQDLLGTMTVYLENLHPRSTGYFYLLSLELTPRDIGSTHITIESIETSSRNQVRRPGTDNYPKPSPYQRYRLY